VAAAISAHRGGREAAPEGTYDAYRHAVRTGAEYIEFDVRTTADGEMVVYHDARAPGGRPVSGLGHASLSDLAGYDVPRVAEVMRLIAGRAIGHVDLKEAGREQAVVELALDILGRASFVVTTREAASVAAIRSRYREVSAALTLSAAPGDRLARAAPAVTRGSRGRQASLLSRIRACQADWVALDHRLASAGLLAAVRGQGIRAMVWTVNGDALTTRFLTDPDVDVVVTDHPGRAIALRERYLGRAG
jgi:glycerophosphoryl diester phosphodiesterase